MIECDADVAVLGSGFGGSLAAMCLHRIGRRVVVLERGSHPRFAIGESSTPIANLGLECLARRFDLPRLLPLSHYGPWTRTYPHIMRGLKRGFTYFHHEAGHRFRPDPSHHNELAVAANPDDERGDTHWLRADVDAFLVDELRRLKIPYLDHTTLTAARSGPAWFLSAVCDADGRREEVRVRADFVIDASGGGGALAPFVDARQDLSDVRTHSRAIFSHYQGVRRWQDVYQAAGGATGDHPFPCDAAALHHVFDGGWMYVLRFDNDVVSAGFSVQSDRFALPVGSPADEWATLLARLPSVAEQFRDAEPLMPIMRMDRVQRRSNRAAGANWAMLPTTAGVIDALHSTGNAHTISGIERLVAILADTSPGEVRSRHLQDYERAILRELRIIDRLVHGCFRNFDRFDHMVDYAMLYFVAVTFAESRRREGAGDPRDGFLLSHDDDFVRLIDEAHAACTSSAGHPERPWPADRLKKWNRVGLCDPNRRNMYPFVE